MKYIFKNKITDEYLATPLSSITYTMNIDEFFIIDHDNIEILKDSAKEVFGDNLIVEDYIQKLRLIKLKTLNKIS